MIAGTLEIQMLANLARLSKDMSEAKGMVGGAMRGIESAVAGTMKVLGSLGVVVSAGMFVRFIDNTIEAMGAVHELSQRTAVSVETLSALELVAKQSGTNMDSVATTIQKLSKNMLEFARDGGGKVGESFKLIGITQKEAADGLQNMDAFLPVFAKKLTESASGGRQVAIAQELMSKSGANLLPFLHQLAEAGRLNAKYTTEQARAADDFKDAQARLASESSKLGIALANDVLPSLNNIATAMIKAREEGEGFWGSMYRGMQTFLTGTDLHKANVQFVKLTDELMRTEAELSRLSSSVAPGVGKRMQDNIARLKGELTALQAFRDQLEAAAAKPPTKTATGGSGVIVDEGAMKARLAMLERYRKLDQAGWVAHIEAGIAEYENGLKEDAKLTEDFYKRKAELDKADQAAVFAMIDAEQEHAIAAGAIVAQGMSENHKQLEKLADESKQIWSSIESTAHDTFINIHKGGKDVFERLTDTLRNGLLELLYQMTLKKWIIQIQEQVTGAGSSGGGSGGILGSIGSLLGFGGGGMSDAAAQDYIGSITPSFATGTDYVPRTGLAMVHQGERIIPASQNGGAPNVQINVVNPPGEPMSAKQSSPRFDAGQYIIDIVQSKLRSDAGVRDGFRSALGPPT